MANSIIMPKTGMAMEEGIIVEWRIKQGDKVAQGDVVAIIETDKSTMELESDYEGEILAILRESGETVPVTQVMAWVGASGEKVPDAAVSSTAAAATQAAPVQSPAKSAASAEAVSTSSAAQQSAAPATAAPQVSAVPPPAAGPVRATPAARLLAKEKGIDLASIIPGGKFGEIKKAAVLAALQANKPFASSPQAAMQAAPGDTRVPLTNIQKITGRRMAESRQIIPEVTSHIKADVTFMLELREEINHSLAAQNMEGKITINDFVLAAVIKALLAYPRINSVLDGNELIYQGSVNLGFAAATKRGLVVPVIHNAQSYSLVGLSAKAAELAASARDGTLKTDEMSGGTLTVSNIGMYGVTSFTPIINSPEAAILGVCAVEDELKLDGEKIVNRKKIGLSLAFDHRIVDGAESSLFLKEIKDNLEAPLSLLL
jgi:pyruvate dehydrogenase E2 component (dihydrolipoamide acetyltransferase)